MVNRPGSGTGQPEPVLTARRLLRSLEPQLAAAGIDDARHELLLLLAHALGEPIARILAHLDDPVSPDAEASVRRLAQRRAGREPFAYITGTTGFSGLQLAVGPGVLVPRPDTECVVEAAVGLVLDGCLEPRQPGEEAEGTAGTRSPAPARQSDPLVRLLDTCTGSGAIGIAIARQLKDAQVLVTLHLLDTSPEALAYAGSNSARWCADLPVRLEQGDLFPVEPLVFDIITANPPYIAEGVLPGLMPEVSRHEPALALAGGEDGLDLYRRILARASDYLRPGGWLLLEHGYDQAEAVAALIRATGAFAEPRLLMDYGGNPRAAAAMRLLP